jgi:hypothetical protein
LHDHAVIVHNANPGKTNGKQKDKDPVPNNNLDKTNDKQMDKDPAGPNK